MQPLEEDLTKLSIKVYKASMEEGAVINDDLTDASADLDITHPGWRQ